MSQMNPLARRSSMAVVTLVMAALVLAGDVQAKKKKNKKGDEPKANPYAEFVWPPPPDDPRIGLVDVIRGRIDVEADSKWRRKLIGAGPQGPYDYLVKPYDVAIDSQGRLLVTDSGNPAVIRFDRREGRMDVLGTQGSVRVGSPLGVSVGPDDTIYVADVGLRRVVALNSEGALVRLFGADDDLKNPTDTAVAPDGKRLFVADSKAHRIVVFDLESGELLSAFGRRGKGNGEFAFPTSLTFDPEGQLFVVDQLNARIQVFDGDGNYMDQFGGLGVGFADFVRPKDIVVDEVGLIYVTDNAFNNVQLFDVDFTLLTFVGKGGSGPGAFNGASGVAVRGDQIAVVDQLGARVQVFEFLVPKDE